MAAFLGLEFTRRQELDYVDKLPEWKLAKIADSERD